MEQGKTRMRDGTILKALSGFYYVDTGEQVYACKARGRFRREKVTPLVGDRVKITPLEKDSGIVEEILPRKNQFIRPPLANIEQMVIMASAAVPVTVPFLIDRIAVVAEANHCEPVICLNKADLENADALYSLYSEAGFITICTSAVTGSGIDELRRVISGKVNAFTGNSGVGKSSVLNALEEGFHIEVGAVSQKLGRGKHTTRHVELYKLPNNTFVADTPGFSSFDTEMMHVVHTADLQFLFREFKPYLHGCRYQGCSHTKEQGCAVLSAVQCGKIHRSRHESYVKLYEQAKQIKEWEYKN